MFWARVIAVICLLDTSASSVTLYAQSPVNSELAVEIQEAKAQAPFQILSQSDLQNVFQIDDQIYSGSEPEGKEGFEALRKMGIKTIVSVDGIEPDLKLAKAAGIKYVHIPIGYDGISQEAGFAFAQVARELKGAIYIHCHHGRHRSPAAAAVVGLCRGSVNKKQAIQFLEQAGTSKSYTGLWRDINQFQVPTPNSKLPKLVESAQIDPTVKMMARISRQLGQLKKMNESEAKHVKEMLPISTLLREEFHETARKYADDYDQTFKVWLKESEMQVKYLETDIKKGNWEQVDSGLNRLKLQCKRCHQRYRD